MRGSSPIRKSDPAAIVYDHEKDVRLSIQLNRWILEPIGTWPRSAESSLIKKFMRVLVNVICTCLIGFLFVPCLFYVIFEVENTYSIVKLAGPLSYCLMVFINYSSLIFHENDIRVCVEHIKNDWINTRYYGDRAIMIRSAEFGRHLVTICALFTYGGGVFFYIAMPIVGEITEEGGNLTYKLLVYPVARMIVDVRYSPITDIFYCSQCLAGFTTLCITIGACGLAAVLAMHAYGRLEILMQWIAHLVDGREDFSYNVDERLTMIVREHVRILRFISLIEKIMHEISLVEIVGCTLNMCFLGYYVIMEWQTGDITNYITYFILLISFTFNIFIFCYIGELVAEQYQRVSEILYMIDWHRLPKKKALAIILMIAMSNSSVKLTAGNLIELSLSSFGDVIKTSVAYLNMLRTLV